MPLYADATALKALGQLGLFAQLQHFARDVVIPKALLYEIRMVGQPLEDALNEGWLRVEEHSITEVEYYREMLGLDEGEAQLFDLIRVSPTKGNNIALIDEGLAFRQIGGRPNAPPVICLADVLAGLEQSGHIPSAEQKMREALDRDYYLWAWNVLEAYLKRCRKDGVAPLPH